VPTPLLQTKLYIPPVRPETVLRPRLLERLDEGLRLGRKLTLVSAPAGFGKTTLLSEWIHAGVGSREYGVGSKEHTSERPPTPYSLFRLGLVGRRRQRPGPLPGILCRRPADACPEVPPEYVEGPSRRH
jgi:hypothetical protein